MQNLCLQIFFFTIFYQVHGKYIRAASEGYDDYTIQTLNASIACGPDQPLITSLPHGLIITPKYDNFRSVASNLECKWTISSPPGMVVELRALGFQLDIACDKSGLEIYDGPDSSHPLIRRYCGYQGPRLLWSSSNSLHVRFYSGLNPLGLGFQLYFERVYPYVTCNKATEKACRSGRKCVPLSVVCDGNDDCGDGTDEEECSSNVNHIDVPCGKPIIPPALGNDRIVGGREAIPGSWPWQVSLRRPDLEPFSHTCGGAMITNQWIVTAAHCFRNLLDPSLWVVKLGKHKKLTPDETEVTRYISEIVIHPEYVGFNLSRTIPWLRRKSYDIALVKLNAPVQYTSYIRPVCLPQKDLDLPEGTLCHVTGWGATRDTGFELVLKQAAVPIVTRSQCQEWFPYYRIGDTMFCAGYAEGGHDSCSGDSGGPLMLQDNSRWHIVGIVSTGGECGQARQPGIYTRLPLYVEWIHDTVESNEI